MKKYIVSIVFTMLFVGAFAQKGTLTVRVQDNEHKEPIAGATVRLVTANFVDATNADGTSVLEQVPRGDYLLEVSFIGYETYREEIKIIKENTVVKVYLEVDNEILEKVFISVSRSSRTIENTPTRVEVVNEEELSEKAIMNAANISMVLKESNGIQIQQTSLSSGNTSIKIQGLDGRYTQLLKDGFPLYGGFSGGLSLMQIPPLDLAQFEIIKGSSSTLYGGGAIAGLVNMVSKKPKEDPKLDVLLTQTHTGGSVANVFYSEKHGKIGYTLYGSGNYQKIYDPDGDHFSNIPQIRTLSFNPKLFYYPNDKTEFWIGVNATLDERNGGDLSVVDGVSDDEHTYAEKNKSKRTSVQAVYNHRFNEETSVSAKQSYSFFDRILETPGYEFSGNQKDVFSEVNVQIDKDRQDWVLGVNYYANSFKEEDASLNRNQERSTFGVFANNIYTLTKKISLETGLRVDHVNGYGAVFLPRISALWNANKKTSFRLGGGRGYKVPSMFTEEAAAINYENIVSFNASETNLEESYGVNFDVNYKTKLSSKLRLSWNQLFYITSIDNAFVLNKTQNDVYEFENANDVVLSRGTETNVKFTYKDLKWYLSYAYNDTRRKYLDGDFQKTLTPKHTAGSVFMYENEEWRVGLETYYTGSQILSSGTNTKDYVLFGFLLQKHFHWGSPFVNFENFTDVRQSKLSNEVSGSHNNPQFDEIYAPTDGFVFSVGVKFNVLGEEHHHH